MFSPLVPFRVSIFSLLIHVLVSDQTIDFVNTPVCTYKCAHTVEFSDACGIIFHFCLIFIISLDMNCINQYVCPMYTLELEVLDYNMLVSMFLLCGSGSILSAAFFPYVSLNT